MQPDDDDKDETATEAESQAPTTEGAPSPTPGVTLDALDSDMNLTLEPPRPPTPKEVLQELDITPYLRYSHAIRFR